MANQVSTITEFNYYYTPAYAAGVVLPIETLVNSWRGDLPVPINFPVPIILIPADPLNPTPTPDLDLKGTWEDVKASDNLTNIGLTISAAGGQIQTDDRFDIVIGPFIINARGSTTVGVRVLITQNTIQTVNTLMIVLPKNTQVPISFPISYMSNGAFDIRPPEGPEFPKDGIQVQLQAQFQVQDQEHLAPVIKSPSDNYNWLKCSQFRR